MGIQKNYKCEYCTFIKRHRKKMWGKRAERPRWRLINKLIRQRHRKAYDNLYIKIGKEISMKIEVALKTTDKTFKEIGAKINETFK